jgi:hypothetical protein
VKKNDLLLAGPLRATTTTKFLESAALTAKQEEPGRRLWNGNYHVLRTSYCCQVVYGVFVLFVVVVKKSVSRNNTFSSDGGQSHSATPKLARAIFVLYPSSG